MTHSTNRLKRLLPLIVVVDVVLVGAVGVYLWKNVFGLPRNFAVVEAGVLYRSGQGSRQQFETAINRYGIKTVICLRKPKKGEDASWLVAVSEAAENTGADLRLWGTESGQPLHEGFRAAFLQLVQKKEHRPVLVHCGLGRHRTGFVCAMYRMVINDWPLEKALSEMADFDFDLEQDHPAILEALKDLDVAALKATVTGPATQPAL